VLAAGTVAVPVIGYVVGRKRKAIRPSRNRERVFPRN
jgi:hypothetical protein